MREEEETVQSKPSGPATNGTSNNTRAVCVPNGGIYGRAGRGRVSERTFGLAACGVGVCNSSNNNNDGSLRERAASGKQQKQGATGMTHEVGRGYAGLSVVVVVDVVTGQSACSSRAQGACELRRRTRQARRSIYSKEAGKLAN